MLDEQLMRNQLFSTERGRAPPSVIPNTPLWPVKTMSPVTVDLFLTAVKTSFPHKHVWFLVMMTGGVHYSHKQEKFQHFAILRASVLVAAFQLVRLRKCAKYFSYTIGKKKSNYFVAVGWMVQSCGLAT